ncbi:acetate/propionate family kinase [Oharaeibacter diazotrophicus]|uniref:Acetate kinase n=2 Tax=Oharaeibacter diazotrophicus TaxID=1920512 RepID=A0A4V6PVD9_9HYPH|nr:acetate/propionate family kinase [Oharaeibacter diazotrophicus]TDP82438.1 acetate kinase [Oharaeibacter diazotrophicus]BBE72799.1 acetate kinase [Pleomorphomonas sp. SM30]GLS76837.1 acetate kinase [Oharaeibacter diazotrophicus]
MTDLVLTLNAGSSSVKFALFPTVSGRPAVARGQVEALSTAPRFRARRTGAAADATVALGEGAIGHAAALAVILGWVDTMFPAEKIVAVGHRIVHGGVAFDKPVALDDGVLAALDALVPLAPLHQPHNLAGVRAARAAFPRAPQVGCFDTAFHRGQPYAAEAFALPRALFDEGVRRYGFHGLSYEYVARRLAPERLAGRVVIAHLGYGASMCALLGGRPMGSTMGFTALDGLPMGTRCGRLDAGVVLHLMTAKGLDAAAVTDLLYNRSGLRGVSDLSGDMRTLLASDRPEARQAIELFVARIRQELGGLAAVLGGLDALVFTGGIGEHAAPIRAAVVEGLEFLGLTLDAEANTAGHFTVSRADGRVAVMVLPTDEETMIAEHTLAALGAARTGRTAAA